MYKSLFSPIKINRLIIKNRITASPTGDDFSDKARGGAGIVVAGHAIVEPGFSSFSSADEPYIFSKYKYESAQKRVLQIHQGGAKAAIELFHGGQDARVKDFAKGPCTLKRKDGTQVVAMDEEMMNDTLDWYYKTAKEAKDIGFDLLFLHFGHGWLPAQFLSPFFNHRKDKFGGSLENRARFPLMILKKVREAVGPFFPIDMRISANEYVQNSISFKDVLDFIKLAEPLIDIVQISAGMDMNREANVHCITTNLTKFMPNVEWAKEVKKQVNIPVSVVGAIPTPDEANKLIADGIVDLVSFGRAFIADPFWPKKAMMGHPENIMPCVRCMYCYHIATNHKNVACTVNPRYHHKEFIPEKIPQAKIKKKVVVIGGGPAGIRAALTASIAGHQVVLFEKNSNLGGELNFIIREHYKKEIKYLLSSLIYQIKKSDVEIRLNTSATPNLVKKENPDSIIIAVGGYEAIPPIDNIKQAGVFTGTEALENKDKLGNDLIILGGGTVGTELALEFSVIENRNVTIVEMGNELAPKANMLYKIAIRQEMKKTKKLKIMLNTMCTKVANKKIEVKKENGQLRELSFDNLIVSTGMRPKQKLAESFFGIASDTNMIGDCVQPRLILDAIFEGHTIALNI